MKKLEHRARKKKLGREGKKLSNAIPSVGSFKLGTIDLPILGLIAL